MAENGVKISDNPTLASAEYLLALNEGTSGLFTISDLGTLLAGGGVLVGTPTTDALSARITAVEDQAFAESPIYQTTAEGIAATGEGDRFRVENADAAIAYDIYDHDADGVATFVTDIPAGSALVTKPTISNALSEYAPQAATARGNIGAAAQTALTDAAGRINYLVANIGGTGNAATCNLADTAVGGAAVSLTRGMVLRDFPWPGTNTGAATLNVGGTGAVAVQDDQGTALPAGALATSDRVSLVYTGAVWRLLGQGYRRIWDRRLRPQRLQTISTANPDAITATTADGTISQYTRGQFFFGRIGSGGNTGGGVTVNIAGLGALRLYEADGSDPAAGRLASGVEYLFQYDGTDFILWAPAVPPVDTSDQLAALSVPRTLEEELAPYAPPAKHIAQAMLAPLAAPAGFSWDNELMPLVVSVVNGVYRVIANPRELVDPLIWTGPVIHVDIATGSDANSGIGEYFGDFSAAKLTIHAAFTAGNALGVPYRVLVMAGLYAESSFTSNGNVEPTQPVALQAYGGTVKFRTGQWSLSWTLDEGTTYFTTLSSTNRAFRTDVLTAEGLYTELTLAADLATCRATPGTWFKDGSTVYVNLGTEPGASDVALIRSFHGARFLTHTDDFYMEGFDLEGGITGAFHADPEADRNIVCVDCTYRYSSPSNIANQQDAFRVRRTNGLVALFNCDASGGAKDGWNFHEDSYPQMYVLAVNCTGYLNGWNGAGSCNAFTTHDGVIAAVIGGEYGSNAPDGTGTTVHCIEQTQTLIIGTYAYDEDLDGDGGAGAFKCSNDAQMWLWNTIASASGGSLTNYAIEANGGTVLKRNHTNIAGTEEVSGAGSIGTF